MAYFTPAQVIQYGEASLYLATNDLLKGRMYSPLINPKIAKVIALELAALKWAYTQSSTYTGITEVSNYVYDLLYKNNIARNIVNGGGGGTPVTPITPAGDCTGGPIHITSANFEADGVTVIDTEWNNKVLQIFWNDIPRFIYDPAEWTYVVGGGFRILIDGFDANTNDYNLYVFVGCFNPGVAVYVPAIGSSSLTQATFDGDGVTTVFNIPHLLSGVPNYVIQPVGEDSAGEYTSEADATNIIITYNVAPPSGTANVIFDWAANLPE